MGVRSARRRGAYTQAPLFEVEVRSERRYYRQMLDALARSDFGTDGLAAELTVSRLFGTVWAGQEGRRDGSTEEAFGQGLVAYARERATPMSAALLATLAIVAPVREVRESAARFAGRPQWTRAVDAAVPERCWSYADVFGDLTTLVLEFTYPSDPPDPSGRHAIAVQVDHTAYHAATDAMLVDSVDRMILELRTRAENSGPMFTLTQVEPVWARAVLGRAFARTDLIEGVSVSARYVELRALAMARVAKLPEAPGALPPEPEPPSEQERQALVEEFLAAASLPDRDYAARVVRLLVDYGCDRDPADITRVSPARWDSFLTEWWPSRAIPGPGLAAVLTAWSEWTARRHNLPELARSDLADALSEELERNALL